VDFATLIKIDLRDVFDEGDFNFDKRGTRQYYYSYGCRAVCFLENAIVLFHHGFY
jgi:hypothetical protein